MNTQAATYYKDIACPAPLNRFIRRFMVVDAKENMDLFVRAPPMGYIYVGWVFGGQSSFNINGKEIDVPRDVFHVSGQIRNADILAHYKGRVRHVVAECSATGFYELTGVAGEEVVNYCGEIPNLRKTHRHLFQELCLSNSYVDNNETLDGRLNAFRAFLSTLANEPFVVPSYLRKAVELFEAADGAIKVSDATTKLNVGQRQFSRRFKKVVGITPKYFCSVLQFRRATEALLTNDFDYLTMLAQHAGYFDHSHFIAVMQKYLMQSPTEFLESDTSLVAPFLSQYRDAERA